MTALLRAELFKTQSTLAGLGLLAALVGLTVLAVVLHALGVAADHVDTASEQLTIVVGRGELLGVLFAALGGALSITAEIRHGTIRPTFLVSPRRGRVVAAKVTASLLVGAMFGLLGTSVAAVTGAVTLPARGIELALDVPDYLLFVAGGAAAGALWATVGVGVGAIVRNPVPALVGLCAWLLFVEGLLVGDVAGIEEVGRFAPGAAAAAVTGQDPGTLLAPAIGLFLLTLYAGVAAAAGAFATVRRDVP
ncbi:MAG: ABC transporter permease [Acidimicrobiia bacterium]